MGGVAKDNVVSALRVDCTLPGREECFISFKADGWKFKHIRLWEDQRGATSIAELISERILDWTITDDGKAIRFVAGEEALDELPPDLAGWVMTAYREAYNLAGSAKVKNSSPPPMPESTAANT